MPTRREFVTSALGGTGLLGLFLKSEKVLSKSSRRIDSIGLQLYTVRKELEKDFESTLRKVAAIGYRKVEFAGYYNRTPAQVKQTLNNAGLSSPSTHLSLQTIAHDLGRAIESAKVIGHRYLVLGYLQPQERKSLDDYKALADLLNRAGEDCRKAKLQLAYHNHDFEFATTNGQVPYDLLLRSTDRELVKMELDLYWITKAMQRPFKRILEQSRLAGVKHYFVEQDEISGSPFESIKTSYEYVSKMRF